MKGSRTSLLCHRPVRVVAATAAALVVCALHYVWRAPDRELARYLAEMEAAGKPTGMSDTALRPLPESQNAAPLYVEAGRTVRAESVPDYGRVDWGLPARMDELRAGVARDRHALDLLHLAAEREGCRFEVSGGVAAQASAESPAWAWTLGGFVVDAAVVAADAGDGATAAERLRLGYVLSRHLYRCGVDTMLSAADHIEETVFRGSARVLALGPLPSASARALGAELRGPPPPDPLPRALEQAASTLVAACAEARAHPLRWPDERDDTVWESLPDWFPLGPQGRRLGVAAYLLSPRRARDELDALRDYARAGTWRGLPYRETRRQWAALRGRWRVRAPLLPVARLAKEAQETARSRECVIARRGLLQAALALHEYKAQHGALPRSLAEVDIEGFPIPDDVFSGKPLVYRRHGSRYTLHSIGPDGEDDGGTLGSRSGDIVWPSPPPPVPAELLPPAPDE